MWSREAVLSCLEGQEQGHSGISLHAYMGYLYASAVVFECGVYDNVLVIDSICDI